jgi:hypothetical protein
MVFAERREIQANIVDCLDTAIYHQHVSCAFEMPTNEQFPLAMDNESIERRIRTRAYELWLADGAMEGCADEYWRQARETVEKEIESERIDRELGGGASP